MREIIIALSIAGVLAGAALAGHYFDTMQLLYAGSMIAAGGLILSVPFAVWYHWKLYRALSPRGELSRRWLWNPTAEHVRLRPDERVGVLTYFYIGALGWVVTVLGLAVVGLGAWVGRSQ